MPSLQALKGIPSFGGELGQALGTGISQGIGANLNQFLQGKKQRQTGTALAQYLGEPEMASTLGGLPEQIQVEIAKAHARKKQESGLSNQEYLSIIEEMEGALDRGEAGLGAKVGSILSSSLQETTAKFQSEGTALLGLAQQIALKQGIRNQKEFQTFLDRTIPNAGDRKGIARGKLNALKSYIQTGNLGRKELSSGNFKKVPSGTKLSNEEAQNIFKRSGNDPAKARKVAQQLGYEW
jgi:hypothetical protein